MEEVKMEMDSEEDVKSESDLEPEDSTTKKAKTKSKFGKSKSDEIEKIKTSKPGIVYLSCVPPGMNVKQIREYFAQFGDIHRSFLQPDKTSWKGKKRNQTFTEGWIEFKKRRHARKAAHILNNNPVGGKKRKVYHDFLWNIKYLQGFQWTHLNERLAYERISKKQKIRTEISAAKREVNFFSKSVDLSKNLKRKGVLSTPKDSMEDTRTKMDNSRIDTKESRQETRSERKNTGLTEERKKFLSSFFS